VPRYVQVVVHGVEEIVGARVEADVRSLLPRRLRRRAPRRRHDGECEEEVGRTTLGRTGSREGTAGESCLSRRRSWVVSWWGSLLLAGRSPDRRQSLAICTN
jgi:hypothetical protein